MRASIIPGVVAIGVAATSLVLAAATIPNVVWEQSDLSITAKAIQATGYTKTLQQCCPLTLFAPTDCAWQTLCEPPINQLLESGNKSTLTSILLHHIVKGSYTLCELQNAKCCPMVLKTLDGGTITVRVKDSIVYVDDSQLLSEGISASNGTVFRIDRVLIPPGVRVR